MKEECFKVRKQTVAGLYFLHVKTCDVGAVPSVMELSGVPEAALFRRLDKLKEREIPNIRPGQLLLAVYGDNWCKLILLVTFRVQRYYACTCTSSLTRMLGQAG